MRNGDSALELISEKYQTLTAAERKIADYIIEHRHTVAEMNVSALAKASDVSDATVVRLCKRLGYKGYHQFTVHLAKEAIDFGTEREEHEALLKEKDPAFAVFNKYAQHMLQITENINTELLTECADMIRKSSFVHITAAGNTNPLAQYMKFRLERLGIRTIAETMIEETINQLNLAEKTETLIAISQSGASKIIVRTAEMAKKKGMSVIAITADRTSPLCSSADLILCSTGQFESFRYLKNYAHLRETAVIDALMEFVTNWDTIAEKQTFKAEEMMSYSKY